MSNCWHQLDGNTCSSRLTSIGSLSKAFAAAASVVGLTHPLQAHIPACNSTADHLEAHSAGGLCHLLFDSRTVLQADPVLISAFDPLLL
jgi:hypothetical protein